MAQENKKKTDYEKAVEKCKEYANTYEEKYSDKMKSKYYGRHALTVLENNAIHAAYMLVLALENEDLTAWQKVSVAQDILDRGSGKAEGITKRNDDSM